MALPAADAVKSASSDDATADELKAQDALSKTLERDLVPALKPMYDMGDDAKPNRIPVDAWINKKDLNANIGDQLSVFVKPRQDAYITILNVGSSGKTIVLYSNHFQRDAKVKAGTTVRIPSRDSKWQITVGGPRGVDLIKVIASRKPLTLKELEVVARLDEKNPVNFLGRMADAVTRDLTPQLKPDADDDKEPGFGIRNILVRIASSQMGQGRPGFVPPLGHNCHFPAQLPLQGRPTRSDQGAAHAI